MLLSGAHVERSMGSLAQLPELVGFFSYSRRDDKDFRGSLFALRVEIQRELSALLAHRNFHLWQDQDAIDPGELWKSKIKSAIEQSAFFIPIVTPRAVTSAHCKFEFESFLARERALGRNDLVFPIHYISVDGLLDEAERRDDPVLSIVAERQYVDWRGYRRKPVDALDFGQEIEAFCGKIIKKLRAPRLTPEERRQQEAETKRREDDEGRLQQDAEAKRQAAEREWLREEAQAKKRTKGEA
jgi:TIR domain